MSTDGFADAGRGAHAVDGSEPIPPSGLPVILIAALVQGWALYGLHEAVMKMHWPATQPSWLVALYTLAVFLPLTVQMIAASVRTRAAAVILAVLGCALMFFGWFHGAQAGAASRLLDTADGPLFGIVLGVLWLMLLPFVQLRLVEGAWRPR